MSSAWCLCHFQHIKKRTNQAFAKFITLFSRRNDLDVSLEHLTNPKVDIIVMNTQEHWQTPNLIYLQSTTRTPPPLSLSLPVSHLDLMLWSLHSFVITLCSSSVNSAVSVETRQGCSFSPFHLSLSLSFTLSRSFAPSEPPHPGTAW